MPRSKRERQRKYIGCPIPFDVEKFLQQLEELMETAYKNKQDIGNLVEQVVGTYHPAKRKGHSLQVIDGGNGRNGGKAVDAGSGSRVYPLDGKMRSEG